MLRLFIAPLARLRRDDGSNLLLVVLIVGLLGSLVASVYVGALRLLLNLSEVAMQERWRLVLVTTGAGCLVALLTHFLGDPGSTEALVDGVHLTGGPSDIERNRSMVPVSLISIGAGGAAGPEAPLVQMTGSLGSWIGRHTMSSLADRRTVTIAGMGVGFSVLFGEPLGGALFALEILHRKGVQYYEAILPALVSSGIGFLAYTGLTHLGLGPVWRFPEVKFTNWSEGSLAIVLSLLGALVALLFGFVFHWVGQTMRRLPRWPRPIIAGLLLGLIGCIDPLALFFGETQLNQMVAMHLAVSALLALVLLKILATSVTLGGGWRGGFIIPLFFMGATLGQAVSQLFGVNAGLAMLVLMTSINVGVTKTPVSTVVLLTTLTGTSAIPALMLASVTSLVVTSRWTFIESQRDRGVVVTRVEPLRPGAETQALANELGVDGPADRAAPHSPPAAD